MNYKMTRFMFLCVVLLISNGCNKVEVSKEIKKKESSASLISLNTFEKKSLRYTEQQDILSQSAINNIGYEIKELSNKNTKKYYYVLNLSNKSLSSLDKKNGIVPYDVIKISIGAKSVKNSNIFSKSATSPVFINYKNSRLEENSYYLFESKLPINKDDFRIDAFFVNAEPFTLKNNTVKKGSQTYHFIEDTKDKRGVISE
ncbi:hypothetical protein [Gottfriedia solisilvae]|uniref:Uncharacterized protein n=1 Tax=Gottfriedia solisilvae TaxID=1516104 RepID=A0A8J3ACU7_9BACI|nr:hypothetical protein [Gottfriedia solisilvae]GGI11554.1 hypothetical protein GCM10007380_08420 [Gottfriedia solisilvae]